MGNVNNTKIIAYYLPQFHTIPENDEWWGKGFTEWVNVKKAKPLYEGHNQPRIPYNDRYYNLLDEKTIEWQSELAEQYGVYGFCFYHYWFNGKLLLEQPMELYLKNKKCKTKYCVCWANENWTNGWESADQKVLVRQEYGDKKAWKEHFDYLKPFFEDERYIKIDNKPLVVLYSTHIVPRLKEMLDYWKELAKEMGFDGIVLYSQGTLSLINEYECKNEVDGFIEYQPQLAYTMKKQDKFGTLRKIKRSISQFTLKHFSVDLMPNFSQKAGNGPARYSYDEIWNRILQSEPREGLKCIPGAFVDWDNTPRKGERGFVIEPSTPEKFGKYLKQQLERAKSVYQSEFLFLFAWNEWAEGGYVEPDQKYGYGNLEAIKKCVDSAYGNCE